MIAFLRDKLRTINWPALATIAVSVAAMVMAADWPRKMALFPLSLGAALLVFSAAELVLSLLTVERNAEGARVDFELSAALEPGMRSRQTLALFGWVIGFLVMIVLLGFLVAIPLFVLLCMRILGREPWPLCLSLSFSSWAFVYVLFDRFLHIPFPQAWLFAFF
jgi:hypothetical protein